MVSYGILYVRGCEGKDETEGFFGYLKSRSNIIGSDETERWNSTFESATKKKIMRI